MDLISVRLSAPAKISGRWLKAGDQGVTPDEFDALMEAGLVDPDRDGFKALVASSDARINAQFGAEMVALQEERDRLKDQVASLESANVELLARAVAAEEQIGTLEAQHNAIMAAVETSTDGQAGDEAGADTTPSQSDAAPDDQNTPPTAKAAKTTPKKGAAAATKG